jgi:ribosomal protein L40E
MTVDKLTKIMEEEGYLQVRKEVLGRKIYFFSLTEKGRKVAEQLKRTEALDREPVTAETSLELTAEEVEMTERLTPLFHINVMDDHITVQENPPGQASRVFNIYIKRNGNGYFRLWCEQDNSFDCWHVKAAWTYPHVQKMMMEYQGKVKICPVCGAENRERAKFCDQCGEKL